MFNNLPPALKTFNQLYLFDPKRLLERLSNATPSGRFSLDLVAGDMDLKELHRLRDREVRTSADYTLKQGALSVGDATFETGVSGVSDKEVEDLPYFESLVLEQIFQFC